MAKSACDETKWKYTAMTSQYQQWQQSVDRVERRLTDIEKRLKQPCDPATAAVRTHCTIYLLDFTYCLFTYLQKNCKSRHRQRRFGVIVMDLHRDDMLRVPIEFCVMIGTVRMAYIPPDSPAKSHALRIGIYN